MSAEVKKTEEKNEKQIDKTIIPIQDHRDTEESEKEVEEVKEPPKKPLIRKIKDKWQLIAKIVQLVICALCLGLFYPPAKSSDNFAKHHLEQVGLIVLTFAGYLLINGIFVISKFVKDTIPFRTSSAFSLIAAVLHFVSAIILLVDRKNKFQTTYYEPQMFLSSLLSASIALCFVNAVLYGLDGVYTFILKKDF